MRKTIVTRLYRLRHNKLLDLNVLYEKWLQMAESRLSHKELREKFVAIYSGYACNASFSSRSPNDPVILTSQDSKLKETDNKLARWWVHIPIRRGRCVWTPLHTAKPNEELLSYVQIGDPKLVRNVNGSFDLHLAVRKEASFNYAYSGILAVELGERFLATSVLWRGYGTNAPSRFHGKNARGVRLWYSWLRKRLGERKLLRVIKRIAQTEHRKITDIHYKVSRAIVDEAKKNNTGIVLGLLKGILNHAKVHRMNRIAGGMPYDKLSRFVEYNASWENIPVLYASEAYTSRECHFCHADGQRSHQGLFRCSACGHRYNADNNGAMNIAEGVGACLPRRGIRVHTHEQYKFVYRYCESKRVTDPNLDRTLSLKGPCPKIG